MKGFDEQWLRQYEAKKSKGKTTLVKKKEEVIKRKEIYAPYQNKLEYDFSLFLEGRRQAGESVAWAYECTRFHLAGPGVTYLIDFTEWLVTGETLFYECKGREWEASILRFRMASEIFRNYRFFKVKRKGKQWEIKEHKKSKQKEVQVWERVK